MIGQAYKYFDMPVEELMQETASEYSKMEKGEFSENSARGKNLVIMSSTMVWKIIVETVDEAQQKGWDDTLASKYIELVGTNSVGHTNTYDHNESENLQDIINLLEIGKKKQKKYLNEDICTTIFPSNPTKKQSEGLIMPLHCESVSINNLDFNADGPSPISIKELPDIIKDVKESFDRLHQVAPRESKNLVDLFCTIDDGHVQFSRMFRILKDNTIEESEGKYVYYDPEEYTEEHGINAYSSGSLEEIVGDIYDKIIKDLLNR